ncbi:MAG: Fis family transcriptional regulator, partial [Pseudomonadales bacterium]|nr:Fis family transcriptional regulator [Pseudomonadales bacterium]
FQHYASRACEHYGTEMPELTPEIINALLQKTWPGNVRELKNAADRFVLGISEDNLHSTNTAGQSPVDYEMRMEQFERQLLEEGLRTAKGQVSKAAELLNITSKTLYRKMKKHYLDKKVFK